MTSNRQRFFLLVLSVGLAIWAGLAASRQKVTPPTETDAKSRTNDATAPARFQETATTLARGVHLLGGLSPSVAYLVETSQGVILIDTGDDARCESLIAQCRQLEVDPKRIRKILLTHGHGDHTFGARYLRQLVGATLYVGASDSQVVEEGGPREAVFSNYGMEGIEPHPTSVDVQLQGGEDIVLGDTTIHAIATPGHTPGSVCYLLQRDGLRILFSGDTIMTLMGDLGTYTSYLPDRYRGSATDFLATLTSLAEMEPPDLILPGHPYSQGAPDFEATDPTVTPEQWQAFLKRGIEEMQRLIARFDSDGRDFLDGEAKEVVPNFFYLGEISRKALYCLRANGALHLFDAPGGSILAGILKPRLARFNLKLADVAAVFLTDCDRQRTSGLVSIVEATGCAVATTEIGVSFVRERCGDQTTVFTNDALPASLKNRVKALPLPGGGVAPVVYSIRHASKTLLVSGQLPASLSRRDRFSRFTFTESLRGLRDPKPYYQALDEVAALKPDVWLPLIPLPWQNANVYGNEWSEAIEKNRRVIAQQFERRNDHFSSQRRPPFKTSDELLASERVFERTRRQSGRFIGRSHLASNSRSNHQR